MQRSDKTFRSNFSSEEAANDFLDELFFELTDTADFSDDTDKVFDLPVIHNEAA